MLKNIRIILICCVSFIVLLTGLAVFAANIKSIKEIEDTSKLINIKNFGAKGDGVSDDSDAINKALRQASNENKVVFFPEGTYLIEKPISLEYSVGKFLMLKGENLDKVKIIGSENLNGTMITSMMRSTFYIRDITFNHKGNGTCVDAFYIYAYNCNFTSASTNPADMLIFTGSNCRVEKCTFDSDSQEAYAICHSRRIDPVANEPESGIAINSYIIDCIFKGKSKGVELITEDTKTNRQLEGLKINNNIFENTGNEQITIRRAFHVDISNNIMSGCQGNAVVLEPGACAIYICGNKIQSAKACVYTKNDGRESDVVISDNIMEKSEIAINFDSYISELIIDNNLIRNVSNGIFIRDMNNVIITNNDILVDDESKAINVLSSNGNLLVDNNNYESEVRK